MHKDKIKGYCSKLSRFVFLNVNSNIIFDMHIEVEEKVMTYSKLYLLDKQHNNEILMLKNKILTFFSIIVKI